MKQGSSPEFQGDPVAETDGELLDKAELAESLATIDKSMEDIKAGRVRPFRAAMYGIARELGLKLDS